jgi:ArsR family transcriptional regulator, arsenate/arsenite/antimonite-responsive transcriptional repressor
MSTANPLKKLIDLDGANLKLDAMARICKAMGHPVRMQIIEFLKAEKQCYCGQIVNRLPLAQSTVSQHLKRLKDAGVIIGEVEGPGTCYCLNKSLLRQFKNNLAQFIDG